MVITLDLKKAVIEKKKLDRLIKSGQRRSTIKSLAWLRRDWRSSLKRRKGPSPPGRPPHIHSRGMGLRTIFFAYDAQTNSGVVGPVKLTGTNADRTSRIPLPALLEGGGYVDIGRRGRRNIRRRIAPRPSGAPALKRGQRSGNIIDPWANMIHG